MNQPENTSCQNCSNVNCPIKRCSPEWMQLISEKREERNYKNKQFVFRKGEEVRGMRFVKSGKVKVISSGWNEKEQIIRLACNGQVLGHRGFGVEAYPVSAIALESSLICFVDNKTFFGALFHNPYLTIKLMNLYAEELRGMEERLIYLAQMTVREKVAFSLLYLKKSFGYSSYEQFLNIDISRADIASLSGLNEEQVVRNLTDFEKEKLIFKVKRKIKILNEKRLQEMASLYL